MHQEIPPTRRELLADWTRSAAKYVAIGVLGVLSAVGISASLLGRQPRPDLVAPSARAVEAESGAAVTTEEHARAKQRTTSSKTKPSTAESASISQLLDLNTATAKELETLPGIGPALAARIVEDREKFGVFATVEQLDRVRGIGPKMMEKLRPLVRVRSAEAMESTAPETGDTPAPAEPAGKE